MLDPDSFYADLRDSTALPLLQEFGFQGFVWVKNSETFDPATGMITSAPAWGMNPCWAVYGAGSSGSGPGNTQSKEGKTLNRLRTKTIYLDASILGIIPATDDQFEDENGNLFEIVNVDETNPGGVAVLWQIKVRR